LYCSEDHKPNRADETRRIEAAGGSVSQGPLGGGPMRVDGALAVSRAFGDFHFKPASMAPEQCKVSAVPEVQTVPGCVAGDWLFLACDGIFDVMENEEVRDFVEARISRDMSQQVDNGQVMADLLKHCLEKGTKDNCTALLIQFGKGFADQSDNSLQLLEGKWNQASSEVQAKYAEFFVAHGFEAEAKNLQAMSSQQSRRPSGGKSGDGGRPSQGRAPTSVGQPGQQMAALTRALQAIRSTRAIQAAWRSRAQNSGQEDDAPADR